jgi:hypothetical protein
LLSELTKTSDERQRRSILRALGSFREPKLAEASPNLVLDPKIDIRESQPLLYTVAFSGRYRETGRLPFEFVQKNFDELVRRLPKGGPTGDSGAWLVFLCADFSATSSRGTNLSTFLKSALNSSMGGSKTSPK